MGFDLISNRELIIMATHMQGCEWGCCGIGECQFDNVWSRYVWYRCARWAWHVIDGERGRRSGLPGAKDEIAVDCDDIALVELRISTCQC